MGAQEVINILSKAEKPLTSSEISVKAGIQSPSIRRILKALLKDVSVNLQFKKLNPQERKERYGKVLNPTLIRIYWLKK